ncbi:hypothetical protein CRG98_030331 [Punica granatum]|uniref:Uncharacterized protein n=1 Tax=Punica granatum TaxID=22663 RepID=A0A2I0IZ59_PUNGR|nr:hypothetical protein CRG98_030331 [Punica granatum]
MTGKARHLERRGLGGFSCAKETHDHLLATGAVRILGPPEALGLFFSLKSFDSQLMSSEYSRATTRVRAQFEAAQVEMCETSLDSFVSHDPQFANEHHTFLSSKGIIVIPRSTDILGVRELETPRPMGEKGQPVRGRVSFARPIPFIFGVSTFLL